MLTSLRSRRSALKSGDDYSIADFRLQSWGAGYAWRMEFNPKGLVVSAVLIALLWVAIEWQLGVVAIAVDAFLAWGLWNLIPDRWLASRRESLPGSPA